jgi:hypothetical protein
MCDRSSGECECFPGYEGRGCRRQKCPNDCSGNGRCIYNSAANSTYVAEAAAKFGSQFWDAGRTRVCACDRGWQGYDCSSRICPKGDDPVTDCRTGGTNDRNSAAHNMVQRLWVQTHAATSGCTTQSNTQVGLMAGMHRTDQTDGWCQNDLAAGACATAGYHHNGYKCITGHLTKATCPAGDSGVWVGNACNPNVLITTGDTANAVNNDAANAVFNLYGYISLKYTDMFGGEYFTRPILIDSSNAARQTDFDMRPTQQWAYTKGQMYQTSASAPGDGKLHAHGTCSVNTLLTEGDCADAGAVWTASTTGFHLGGAATTTHATVSQDRMKTATLKRYSADRIRHALQDLPNFVIPTVNVTNFVDGGNMIWGNAFDITFTDTATSGEQNLLECVFDSARGCDGAQPKMKSVTVPSNTKTATTGTSQIYTVGGSTQVINCNVFEVPLTGSDTYEEHSECSNRGLCDASSGICDCFEGHTGEACSTQTIFF